MSHDPWLPKSALNSRFQPVGPQREAAAVARPPTTLPFSLPLIRPRPL